MGSGCNNSMKLVRKLCDDFEYSFGLSERPARVSIKGSFNFIGEYIFRSLEISNQIHGPVV
jgi:hypothetical protein